MDPEIILSLLDAEKGFTGDSIYRHRVESPEAKKAWEQLDMLLSPANEEALELASAYGSEMERDGFLNGFRLATRLMMESLISPPQRAERSST